MASAAPALVPDHVAIVQPDGDVVPRAGVTWDQLWSHGVTPDQVDGAERVDGGWSLPTKAAPPAWFQGSIRERLEAGEAVPLETIRAAHDGSGPALPGAGGPTEKAGPTPPASPPPVGLRPGSGIGVVPFCTAAFLHEHVDTGDLAIATAGHCVDEGETVGAFVVTAQGRISVNLVPNVGEVIHSVNGPDVPDDAALIDIHDRYEHLTSPRMAGWDGPCGARTGFARGDSVVKWGQGTDPGVGSARGGVVSGSDARLLRWTGAQIPGDSGAGVRFATEGTVPAEEAGAAGIATRFDLNPFTPWTANGPDTEYVQDLLPDDWQIVSSPGCA